MEHSESTKYLTSHQVRARFGGVSSMTLWRWAKDDKMGFPIPMRLNRRKLFNLADIEKWERETAIRGGR